MLGTVFERFVEKSPISVMVRGTLERVLGAESLNQWYERTAEKQYTRELLFSTVYDLMSQVVFRIKPSIHAAYRDHETDTGASVGEHLVILTLPVIVLDGAQTLGQRCRSTWHNVEPTSGCSSLRTTKPPSA